MLSDILAPAAYACMYLYNPNHLSSCFSIHLFFFSPYVHVQVMKTDGFGYLLRIL